MIQNCMHYLIDIFVLSIFVICMLLFIRGREKGNVDKTIYSVFFHLNLKKNQFLKKIDFLLIIDIRFNFFLEVMGLLSPK